MSIKIPKAFLYEVGIPAIILCIGTLIFRFTNVDIAIEELFFVPTVGWVSKNVRFWKFLHDFGPLPAIITSIFFLLLFIASFRIRRVAAYRKTALFIVLVMLLGPGLIINSIFKDHWGRPRPRSIHKFEGHLTYLPIWQKGISGNGHSFPSGHASMGYFLMTPFFLFRKRARRRAVGFLTLGIGLGLLIGLGRMIQGGHFASDVMWAGGFVYFCGLGLAYALRLPGYRISESGGSFGERELL